MSWGTKAVRLSFKLLVWYAIITHWHHSLTQAVAGVDSGAMTARLRGQRNTQSAYQSVSAHLVVAQIVLMVLVLVGTAVAQYKFQYAFLAIGGALMAIGLFLMISSFAFYLTRTRAAGVSDATCVYLAGLRR